MFALGKRALPMLFAAVIATAAGCAQPVASSYPDPQQLADGIAAKKLVVIDVRSPAEYQGGHIPTARNIPHTEMESHLSELPKDQEIVLYCRSGARADTALKVLQGKGYGRVYNFGGVSRWKGKLE